MAERLDGDRLRTGRGTHVLRRAAAAAVLLAGVLAPGLAYADDGPALGTSPGCLGSTVSFRRREGSVRRCCRRISR
ncbi:hypothetical protein GCM10010350_72360 [Streptomyces galilaeus]|nr:hypothetical protein GCM10010350_72360 [Streptomyces galilaeus]